MRSNISSINLLMSVLFVVLLPLYGCLFLPASNFDLLKEYVFVEVRDGGRCVDTLSVLFTRADIDTTEKGKLLIILHGLYSRSVYYEGNLIYRRVDTAQYVWGSNWREVEFWRFSEGCVCESDKEYVMEEIEMFGHLLDKQRLLVYYKLFGITERKIKGLFGGCKGELSYYELVYVRDLTSE